MDHDELFDIGLLLQRVSSIVSENVATLHDHLAAMCESARSQLRDLEALTERTNRATGEALADVMKTLGFQNEDIHELFGQLEKQAESMSHAVEAANRLQSTATDLSGIASESRLLSVNAKIEAANLGPQSRSIQVIASSVRNLSKSLHSCVDRLEEVMKSISETVPQLEERMNAARRSLGTIESKHQGIEEQVEKLKSILVEESQQALVSSRERVEKSVMETHQTLAKLQSFDEVIQILNAALIRLGTGQDNPDIGTPPRLLQKNPQVVQDEVEDIVLF